MTTVNYGNPIAVAAERLVKDIAQRPIFPITLGAIARGKFSRKSNDAV